MHEYTNAIMAFGGGNFCGASRLSESTVSGPWIMRG